MEIVTKKVPLFSNSAKKDTLISDLLRSEPHYGKGTLFWEFSYMPVNIYRKSGPPGNSALTTLLTDDIGSGLVQDWFGPEQIIIIGSGLVLTSYCACTLKIFCYKQNKNLFLCLTLNSKVKHIAMRLQHRLQSQAWNSPIVAKVAQWNHRLFRELSN